jgi:hypothetical protein
VTQTPDLGGPSERDLEASKASLVGRGNGVKTTLVVALLLSGIVLISLYIRVQDYGFYEDDYWAIVPYFKTPFPQLWANLVGQFHIWSQGRPLNHSIPMLFSRLGYGLAGVPGIYFLGFLVQFLNTFLVYHLLKRWIDPWSAILGGCLMVLLPADTTHIFLEHSAQLHTSLTYLLIGLLLNRTRFWIFSYPIAALSLLSYETAFLPFIVFPLFFVDRKRRILRWVTHLLICGAILIAVFGIRLRLSDSRANDAVSQAGGTLWRMISSLWIGPMTSAHTILKAILEGPHSQTPFAFLVAALVVILLLSIPRLMRAAGGTLTHVVSRNQCVTLFFAGLASWIFAYALTIVNYPPTRLSGRFTSTHLAAVFGLACSFAAAAAYFRSFRDFRLKTAATGVMSLLVGLFILYAFHIQSGYAVAWEIERRFWRRVVELCPDITPNTRVILVGTEPRQNEFITSNSWADPLVLRELFTWSPGPLFCYYSGTAKAVDVRFENGQITWNPFFWGDQREILNPDDLILLQDDGNAISRTDELRIPEIPFPLHSRPLAPREAGAAPPPLSDFGRFLLKP